MANYTPTFSKPYPSGWVDKPSKTTPATAAIMNSYDTAIAALETYLRDNAIKNVSADTTVKSGAKIATITIDGTEYVLYSPSVSYESAITGGTKVGTITVGANTFDVYAPTSSAGGSTVSVVPKTLTGTNIAEITVDGTTYQLYAPTSGGSGSTVTAEAILTEGTQIGKITIDGVETILYAPTASPITVDSELSSTSINPVQNKAIAEEFQKYANGTKVVAKATEANTATTASNSEKVNGHTVGTDVPSNAVFTDTVYDDSAVKASIQNIVNGTTQVGSATKATQDAQGNVIDTTYAKKTEVPQGTVVDDALSSTSTNPVQNKVVKAEFDQVNSNLDGLGYGENGAYNLINPTLQTTTIAGITCTSNGDGIYTLNGSTEEYPPFKLADVYLEKGTYLIDSFSYDGNNPYLWVGKDGENNNIINQFWTQPLTFTLDSKTLVSIHMVCVSGQNFSDKLMFPMLIKGTSAQKQYKPYIPSVKMLAEEVNQQKNDLGCLEFNGWTIPNDMPLKDASLVDKVDMGSLTWNYISSGQFFYADLAGGKIGSKNAYCSRYNLSNSSSYGGMANKEFMLSVSSENVSRVFLKDTTYTDETVLKNSLNGQYLYFERVTAKTFTDGQNVIDQLKNDLSNLKDGTTPVAKAVADEDENNIKSTYATKTELDAKANIADPVFTGSFSMGRKEGSTVGQRSHAEGSNTLASDINAHAEGSGTKATNANAHAEGRNTTASGLNAHAEGNNTSATASYTHAEGSATKATYDCAHAEGNGTTASGMNSHAEGSNTLASGHSGHSEGYKTTALEYQHAGGHYNNTTTATTSQYTGTGTGTSFVIGNGTEDSLSNAFRINDNGEVFAKSATISTGADYAEYFEWEDENQEKEDRRGYFVTLNNKKIKLAQPGDYILGIVSGFPSVIGNGDEEWMGRYIFDDFGTPIYEEFVYEDLITGEKKTGTKWKENPDYDKERPYIQRSKRPEWDAVGMLGVLAVRHDGTAKVNGYVTVNKDGIATACDRNIENSYRVIKANTDSVVEVIFK